MSKRILFFGNERLATGVETTTPVLRQLLSYGYEVAAVVVAQDKPLHSRRQRRLEIAEIAAEHQIPFLQFAKLLEHKSELEAYQATAAVLVAYGKLIPLPVIELFPAGIINIHPSLLPKHRGPTPIESVILNGDPRTGVSLMQLGPQMDAGGVFAQQPVRLTGNETKQALADQLSNLGSELLVRHLPAILEGTLPAKLQDESEASYNHLIKKEDGVIGPGAWKQPAEVLERRVRAYAGWPRARTTLTRTDIVITAAHVEAGQGAPGSLWLERKQLGVFAQDGILVIDRLIPNGKKEMPAAAFLAGYRPEK
jgi:methionyl-tRNA formyltransferase